MRKLVTWLVVALGVAAIVRRLKRRRELTEPAPVPSAEDPAVELRRKLAESRADAAPAETTPDASVAERRAAVHDEGRGALEEMRAHDPAE